jgi:hypothetical protein
LEQSDPRKNSSGGIEKTYAVAFSYSSFVKQFALRELSRVFLERYYRA